YATDGGQLCGQDLSAGPVRCRTGCRPTIRADHLRQVGLASLRLRWHVAIVPGISWRILRSVDRYFLSIASPIGFSAQSQGLDERAESDQSRSALLRTHGSLRAL